MNRAFPCLVLFLVLAACNPFATFDPEEAANKIILNVGGLRTDLGCSQLPDIGGTRVCVTHSMTPADARDEINGVMRFSGADPMGAWDASPGGYSRSYRYGENFQTFIVIVNTGIMIMSYD